MCFFALFVGKRGPPCENIGRDLHFAPKKWTELIPEKNVKNRDLEISQIPNIDEVDGIYLA